MTTVILICSGIAVFGLGLFIGSISSEIEVGMTFSPSRIIGLALIVVGTALSVVLCLS